MPRHLWGAVEIVPLVPIVPSRAELPCSGRSEVSVLILPTGRSHVFVTAEPILLFLPLQLMVSGTGRLEAIEPFLRMALLEL